MMTSVNEVWGWTEIKQETDMVDNRCCRLGQVCSKNWTNTA